MVPEQPTNPHFRKIGVLRSGGLGDMLVALPALHALRKHFLHSEIILLTDKHTASYTSENRFPIDRIIELPSIKNITSRNGNEWHEYPNLVLSLQKEKFDLFLNFQGKGITANPFLEACKAKKTISFKTKNASFQSYIRYSYYQPEVIRLWELVQSLGVTSIEPFARYNITKNDQEHISSFLNNSGPFVVIGPLAYDIRRTWPIDNYIPIIHALYEKGFEIIITGTREQENELSELNKTSGNISTVIAGKLDIPKLAALLSRAEIVIGPDTGIIHLARSVDTPTLGVYWAPNLINWGPLTRNRHGAIISWDLHCPICFSKPLDPYPYEPKDQCKHEVSFVQQIKPEQVIHELNQLINISKTKTAYE